MRARRITTELHWFASLGHKIPEAGPAGISYGNHLMELSRTNIPAFISHLRDVYFAHSAGDHFLVQKVCATKCSQVGSLYSLNKVGNVSCMGS